MHNLIRGFAFSRPKTRRLDLIGRTNSGLAIVTAVAMFIALVSVGLPSRVRASVTGHNCHYNNHCTEELKYVSFNSDKFYNYDLDSTGLHNDNVDWPVNLVFYNNAAVWKVKDYIHWYNQVGYNGSPKWLHLREGDYFNQTDRVGDYQSLNYYEEADADSGRKDVPQGICVGVSDAIHYRPYADESAFGFDTLYNDAWGFYVIATSHVDRNDGCTDAEHGWSNHSEWIVYSWSLNVVGWVAYRNYLNLFNPEPGTYNDNGGTHHWRNDGLATVVNVN